MADVFEDRRDLDRQRMRLWELINVTRGLDWLLLTKRPENVERFAPDAARAELIAWQHRTSLGGDDQEELTAQLDGLRSRQATRMLRDAVGSEGGASHG